MERVGVRLLHSKPGQKAGPGQHEVGNFLGLVTSRFTGFMAIPQTRTIGYITSVAGFQNEDEIRKK